MRIDHLVLKHFKCFEDREFSFHPEFNLLVGRNGTGKTSALDALAVAVSSWFLRIGGTDNARPLGPNEIMLRNFEHEETDDQGQRHVRVNWERLYPCEVAARGGVQGKSIGWLRGLKSAMNTDADRGAEPMLELASAADTAVREGKEVSLPLISYYGTERLCQGPEPLRVTNPTQLFDKEGQSCLAGYRNSINPRLSVDQLTRWIVLQSWIAYQRKGQASPVFEVVKKAIVGCVEGASDLYFDVIMRGLAVNKRITERVTGVLT